MNRFIVEVVDPQKKTIAMLMVKEYKSYGQKFDIDGTVYGGYVHMGDALRTHLLHRFSADALKGCTTHVHNEFIGL